MPTQATVPPALDDLPDEFFLEGPVPGGEDLLRRTVAKVHQQSARTARLRNAALAGAVVLAGGMVMGAGMAIGHWMTPGVVAEHVVAMNSATGAELNAELVPVDGGTHLDLMVTGLPLGTACRLTVVSKQGVTQPGGSWRIGADDGRRAVTTSAWVPPDDIGTITVTTSTGMRLSWSAG